MVSFKIFLTKMIIAKGHKILLNDDVQLSWREHCFNFFCLLLSCLCVQTVSISFKSWNTIIINGLTTSMKELKLPLFFFFWVLLPPGAGDHARRSKAEGTQQ